MKIAQNPLQIIIYADGTKEIVPMVQVVKLPRHDGECFCSNCLRLKPHSKEGRRKWELIKQQFREMTRK